MDSSTPNVDQLLGQALGFMAKQQPAPALKLLGQIEQLEPGSARVLYLKGVVHMQSGVLAKALELMRKAVKVDPTLYVAHFHIGFLHFNADRQEEARRSWQALEPLGEDHPLVLFTRGVDAWERDDFSAARKYLERGLELNGPQGMFNAEMKQLLEWVDEEEEDLADASRARGRVANEEEPKAGELGGSIRSLPPLPGMRPLKPRSTLPQATAKAPTVKKRGS